MSEPLFSPWIIYYIIYAETIKWIFGIAGMVLLVIGFVMFIAQDEDIDIAAAVIRRYVVVAIFMLFCAALIPNKEAALAMYLSNSITQENYNSRKEVLNQLIETTRAVIKQHWPNTRFE